jgi:VWFA-related protein
MIGRRPNGMSGRAAAMALSIACAGVAAAGQTPTFSTRTDVVRLDVLVTDGTQPITGLEARDFEVLDNGVPQQVELIAFEDAPLNVVLALDMSRSVSGLKLVQLRSAAQMVIGSLAARDKGALLSFASTVFSRVPLTDDRGRLIDALAATPTSGDTAVIDASYGAIVLSESDAGRPIVMIFSDGVDTASFLTAESVLNTTQRSDAVVYAVATSDSRRDRFLEELCLNTGGRLVDVRSSGEFRQTFLGLLREFRHRYLLSYRPTGAAQPGWHALDVRVKDRPATIKVRPGYFRR